MLSFAKYKTKGLLMIEKFILKKKNAPKKLLIVIINFHQISKVQTASNIDLM